MARAFEIRLSAVLLTSAFLCASTAMAEDEKVFEWVDKEGVAHFTNDPQAVPNGEKATVSQEKEVTVIHKDYPAPPLSAYRDEPPLPPRQSRPREDEDEVSGQTSNLSSIFPYPTTYYGGYGVPRWRFGGGTVRRAGQTSVSPAPVPSVQPAPSRGPPPSRTSSSSGGRGGEGRPRQ